MREPEPNWVISTYCQKEEFFADRYGLSPAQFDRAYPSGKREWLALARKARELTVFDRQALKWDRVLDVE